jgi:energy-coupling factor transport system substrate-specific component
VTWEVLTFGLLTLVLAVGFAWYERTHPSSKVLAMVATLAALAALGRVAFAPLPNVKPTTDIVFLAGYVLGGAPGFAVGALAALSSNLVFGQGPWTPWQMVGWGVIGVVGAAWAPLTRGRLPRIPTSILLVLAAFFFGALTNLSTLTAAGGTPSWGQFIAVESAGIPFDVAHAAGNVVFFLAFGPAFARVLQRYRARLQVRWISVLPTPTPDPPTPSP